MLIRPDFFDLWSVLLGQGIPMLESFEIAARELHGEGLGEALVHMSREVSAGGSVAEATREYRELFPPPIPDYIRSWEASGTFEEGLTRLVAALASGEFPDARESTITAALKRLTVSCEIMLRGGLPLLEIFDVIAAAENNKKVEAISREVGQTLKDGGSLGDALGRHPDVFSAAYVALVHKAEMNGRLDETFGQLSRGITRKLFLPPT